MTPQEAVKQIDDVLSSDYHYDETLGYQLTSDDLEWLEKSKEALGKQIPKRLNLRKTGYRSLDYVCPECTYTMISRIEGMWVAGERSRYCSACGQALDWSDTE